MTIDLDLDVKQSVQIETIGPITERQNRLVGFFQWLDKIVLFLIFFVLILMSLVDHLTFGSHSMKICINTKFYWSNCCFCRPRKRIKSKILFSSFLLLGLVFFSISKMKSTLLILWIVKKNISNVLVMEIYVIIMFHFNVKNESKSAKLSILCNWIINRTCYVTQQQ